MSLWKTVSILVVVLFIPVFAFSDTIIVPDDYPTIQGAIDAAVNGDTVLVKPGTYLENIDFKGKAITVTSELGADVTVIDGNQAGSVVTFQSGEGLDSVLHGFTVTNGSGTPKFQYKRYGGGIYCNGSSPKIINNIISNNSAAEISGGWGGGIYCADSSPIITNNVILKNMVGWMYGDGGGIHCSTSSPTITNNTITLNMAVGDGGGICCSGSSPTITNNTISRNDGYYCGGIYCINSYPTITNTIVWENISYGGYGYEIYVQSGNPTVTYSCVQGNYPGTGNIDADPLFVDPANDDIHLTFNSPCRGSGDNSAVTELYDFEGDPRICQGTVDIGADECYRHLYCMGDFTPGGAIEGKFIGLPGTTPVGLFVGSGVLPSPLPTMWGDYWLQAPYVLLGPLGTIPYDGVMVIPATLPPGMTAPVDIPMQALIGLNADSLSNLCVLQVR